jgi:carnitine 3-dehydrogenase
MTAIAGVEKIVVVGTGAASASWAALFLARGLDVVATDPDPRQEEVLRRLVDRAWPSLETSGIAAGSSPKPLRFESDLARACVCADFVQENLPETLETESAKTDLFVALDRLLGDDVIIASSSSAVFVSQLQARCRFPSRIVLGHPFNPPHLTRLVEVVGGERTSPATIRRALAFYSALGKNPLHLAKEVKGQVADRIQAAVFREAIHLLTQGVATLRDIDQAMSVGLSLRWTLTEQFLTYHLGGGTGGTASLLKQFAQKQMTLWQDLGDPVLTPELQQRVVDELQREAIEGDMELPVVARNAAPMAREAQKRSAPVRQIRNATLAGVPA